MFSSHIDANKLKFKCHFRFGFDCWWRSHERCLSHTAEGTSAGAPPGYPQKVWAKSTETGLHSRCQIHPCCGWRSRLWYCHRHRVTPLKPLEVSSGSLSGGSDEWETLRGRESVAVGASLLLASHLYMQ